MMYEVYSNYIDTFVHQDLAGWSFKSNPDYVHILEHVNEDQGRSYLQEIFTRFPELYYANKDHLIKLCNTNDSCGQPNKTEFSELTTCSPTNLRYILHSFLLLTHATECKLDNIDIIEIGGGYGGLCFHIHNLAHLFNIKINSYSIFDLQNPLVLQKKYLTHFGLPDVNCVHIDNFSNIKQNSYLVSTYAFSEIDLDIQKKYTELILNPYVSHGFIAWNHIDVYDFINNKEITDEIEYPLTGGKNRFVRFRPL